MNDNISIKVSDTYKVQEGEYYKGDTSYESLEDLIMSGILDFCGCGNVNDTLLFILGALEVFSKRDNETYEEKVEASNKYHGSLGASYFFYNWLDQMRFTEHGGSVPSWLTESGTELLELLREYKDSL